MQTTHQHLAAFLVANPTKRLTVEARPCGTWYAHVADVADDELDPVLAWGEGPDLDDVLADLDADFGPTGLASRDEEADANVEAGEHGVGCACPGCQP